MKTSDKDTSFRKSTDTSKVVKGSVPKKTGAQLNAEACKRDKVKGSAKY